ncbi:MAG TPA: thermonuclease family protein [Microbacterium sp.]|nr:thermonuclease family protein [Microbacterium sp.]
MGHRRGGNGSVILGALVIAGIAVWVLSRPDAAATPPAADPAASAAPSASVPTRPADAFPMTVGYVFDGDTIELQHGTPNDVVTTTAPIRVRLIGIDTPEGTPAPECWSDEARSHLAAVAPEGATVWVALDPAGIDASWDRYDRRLFYLWTDDGRFVNHELMAAGDAEALRVEPNDAHHALFVTAQAAARAAGVGQWGAC